METGNDYLDIISFTLYPSSYFSFVVVCNIIRVKLRGICEILHPKSDSDFLPTDPPDGGSPVAPQVPAQAPCGGSERGRDRGHEPTGTSPDVHLHGDAVHRRHSLPEHRRTITDRRCLVSDTTQTSLSRNWAIFNNQTHVLEFVFTSLFLNKKLDVDLDEDRETNVLNSQTHIFFILNFSYGIEDICLLIDPLFFSTDYATENRPQSLCQRISGQLWHVRFVFICHTSCCEFIWIKRQFLSQKIDMLYMILQIF